jgi:hypothetical protein
VLQLTRHSILRLTRHSNKRNLATIHNQS